MDAQILRELETAAQILLAPPNLVTNEQRHAAETVFMNFRKTKSPYILCKQILETSRVDYVLFEVAGLLKDALIREWTFLQESDIVSLRQYLLQYVIERSTLPPFVRERILQVIAIMVKRGSVEDFGMHRGILLNEVEHLILNGDHSRQLLGCSIISSMMQEYAITVKSSDVGLTWETHFKAKKQFEVTDLKRIFQFCCRALGSLAGAEPPFSHEVLSLVKHLLSITETILTWGFITCSFPKRLVGVFEAVYESDQSPSLRLGPIWKDAVLDPQVVNLFFTVYWKIRMNPQLSHHALTCLVQLASVNGAIFPNKESRIEYVTNYLEGFIKLVTSVEILDREALGISNIVRKLFMFYPPLILTELPSSLLQSFLEQFALLTCNFAEGAATEETLCAEDRLYMEAFDHMMEAWITVLSDVQAFSKDYCKTASIQIFNIYLKCHLSPPEGNRGQGRELEVEELDESEEIDRVKFKDQLQTIGNFGRHSPEHSLPLLARLLEDRTKRLRSQLDRLLQHPATISDSSSMVLLFEDLHWLLLIAGNVISMDSVGETQLIPSELMRHSIAQSESVSIEVSLQVFASPNRNLEDIQDAEQKTDHIIRLVAAVFRLSYVLKGFIEAKLVQFLSPEVVSSLLWFLKHWSLPYLLPNEGFYSDLSMALVSALGRDSEGGAWTTRFLLEQVATYLVHFSSEPGVTQDAVNLFTSLMDTREKGFCVLKSGELLSIMKLASSLQPSAKRGVYRGLTLAGAALQDSSSRNGYWNQVLKPLQDRFKTLVCQENFNRVYHEENVKNEVLDILECLIGVALGAHSTTVQALFQYLGPILSELSTLIGVYHNYQQVVELILSLFCECARCLISYLTQSESRRIYEACLHTIQTYAKCNAGRLSLDSDAQEDSFRDILLLMELLTNLLSKDFIDLSRQEPTPENDTPLTAADVCLYGLNIIMPLMTVDLLKYPALCLQYFKMITYVCEIFPEKVCQLPENLLKSLLSSIELGLTAFGQEIILLCCDFLQILGSHVYNNTPAGETPHQALKPFLKLLMNLILSRQINSDLLPNTSTALFVLICCYQQEYQTLVEAILTAQPDPVIGERLAKAFTDLTANVTLSCERQNRLRFRDNFEKFIVNVHGFLHVK